MAADGAATFEGRPCRTCAGTTRYANNGRRCVRCRRRQGRASTRRHKAAHPEKVREQDRRWKAANLKRTRGQARRWKDANLERVREQNRRRYAANVEKERAKSRRWQAAHPEIARAKDRRRRARKKTAGPHTLTAANVRWLWEVQDGRCAYCAWQIFPNASTHVDHVIPLASGGAHAIENCVLACARCNMMKGVGELWPPLLGHLAEKRRA